jgi:hypothetical protein
MSSLVYSLSVDSFYFSVSGIYDFISLFSPIHVAESHPKSLAGTIPQFNMPKRLNFNSVVLQHELNIVE